MARWREYDAFLMLRWCGPRELAVNWGISLSMAYRYARRAVENGVPVRYAKRRGRKRPNGDWPSWYFDLVDLVFNGLSIGKAAERLGRSRGGCYWALRTMAKYYGMDAQGVVDWLGHDFS